MTTNDNNKDSDSNKTKTLKYTEEEKKLLAKAEKIKKQMEEEIKKYEISSNKILDGVRKNGESVQYPDGTRKQLPEEISDIHIMWCRQKPEYVVEGVDTSDKDREEDDDEEDDEEEDDDS